MSLYPGFSTILYQLLQVQPREDSEFRQISLSCRDLILLLLHHAIHILIPSLSLVSRFDSDHAVLEGLTNY